MWYPNRSLQENWNGIFSSFDNKFLGSYSAVHRLLKNLALSRWCWWWRSPRIKIASSSNFACSFLNSKCFCPRKNRQWIWYRMLYFWFTSLPKILRSRCLRRNCESTLAKVWQSKDDWGERSRHFRDDRLLWRPTKIQLQTSKLWAWS